MRSVEPWQIAAAPEPGHEWDALAAALKFSLNTTEANESAPAEAHDHAHRIYGSAQHTGAQAGFPS